MIDAAKMIARHLPNVLTYFSHRISNAVAEGPELEGRHHPEPRLRLSQSQKIQDRRVLPLRWPSPLASEVDPLKSRMNLF
jgi:hypothetical protein